MISIYPPVTIRTTAWMVLPVEIQLLDDRLRDPELMPEYKTAGASGMDLRAMAWHSPEGIRMPVFESNKITLWPGMPEKFGSGVAMAIPSGYEGQIRPRSGMNIRGQLGMFGTIDSDYRGEFGLILVNLTREAVEISGLDRIAQLVIAPVVRAELQVVDTLPPTDRGSGGYGSTGVR